MSYFLSFLKAWMYFNSNLIMEKPEKLLINSFSFFLHQGQINIFNIVKFCEKAKKTVVNSFKFC
jgi:hypothetical protein